MLFIFSLSFFNPTSLITMIPVRRGDVLSAWCGIRPLVCDPNKGDTQSIARNHIIEVSKDKLITIAGNLLV